MTTTAINRRLAGYTVQARPLRAARLKLRRHYRRHQR